MPTVHDEHGVADRLPLHPRDFHILLGLMDGARHGYGLVQEIDRRTDGAVRLDPANLYRALHKLLEDDLVTEADAPPSDAEDNRTRRYYRITDLGRLTLAAEAERMRRLADAVDSRAPLPSSGKS